MTDVLEAQLGISSPMTILQLLTQYLFHQKSELEHLPSIIQHLDPRANDGQRA
jgi:hypothetical protein